MNCETLIDPIETILRNHGRSPAVIVVTDGEPVNVPLRPAMLPDSSIVLP